MDSDITAVFEILNREIREGVNAFDTQPVVGQTVTAWLTPHHDPRYPIVVADAAGVVIGWASLSPWSRHGAYERAAEVSVFVHADHRGRAIGRALLRTLVRRARTLGHHVLIARTEASNEASARLHVALGFSEVGVMHEVGWKFGQYLDVLLLERVL